MNPTIKRKLTEGYRKTIKDRLESKGIKVSEMKMKRMVEAAMIRMKFLEAASTTSNTSGRGGFVFGNNPTDSADNTKGSGELYDELFGLFIDAYATTVGFDIIHTKQMTKGNITVNILEPIYGDGRIEGTDAGGSLPVLFKVDTSINAGAPTALVIGTQYDVESAVGVDDLMKVIFVGKDRARGWDVFRIVSVDAGEASNPLSVILDTATNSAQIFTSAGNAYGFDPDTVEMVEANVNHVQGFAAAGLNDTDAWTMNGHNGDGLRSGNSRPVGESRDYRTMSFRKWNRNFSANSHKVKVAFTREMYQDMLMEEDTDLRDMSDVIGAEELTQSINQNVLSEVFANGWEQHVTLQGINGFNANLNLSTASTAASTFAGADGAQLAFPVATPAGLNVGFDHNIASAQRLLVTRIGFGAGVIGNLSRMGKGDTCVAGTANTTAISDIRGFREDPFDNDLVDNQDVTFMGSFKKIGLYEDTSMAVSDKRISISKKGNDKSSGLTLCNYILADSVKTVAEGLGEEVSMLTSRMVVAKKGSNPSLNYLTLEVTGEAIV